MRPHARAAQNRNADSRRRGWAWPRARSRALLVVIGLLTATMLTGAAPASAAPFIGDCKEGPEPDRPGSGMVGVIDPAPMGTGEPGTVYDEVGYSGMVWHTYDLGCGPDAVRAPEATLDTTLGNYGLDFAKIIVAGTNWLHYQLLNGDEIFQPLDDLIVSLSVATYGGVFMPLVGLALLILAVIILFLGGRGDNSRVAQRTGMGLAALGLAATTYLTPLLWTNTFDDLLFGGANGAQNGILSQLGYGDQDALPTTLVDSVIYQNWERGQFGLIPQNPEGQQFSRDVLRAQTFTKQEVADGQDNGEAADLKKAQYQALAEQMGDRYDNFTGKSGSRTGTGILAATQALAMGLFQLAAKLLLITAVVIIRLLVIAAPIAALGAMVKPDILNGLLRIAGAALLNTVMSAAIAGIHAAFVVSLIGPQSPVGLFLAIILCALITFVAWSVLRPIKRLLAMGRLLGDQLGGGSSFHNPYRRLERRLRRQQRAMTNAATDTTRPESRGDGPTPADGGTPGDKSPGGAGGSGTPRPEAQPGTIFANATRTGRGGRRRATNAAAIGANPTLATAGAALGTGAASLPPGARAALGAGNGSAGRRGRGTDGDPPAAGPPQLPRGGPDPGGSGGGGTAAKPGRPLRNADSDGEVYDPRTGRSEVLGFRDGPADLRPAGSGTDADGHTVFYIYQADDGRVIEHRPDDEDNTEGDS